MVKIKSQRRHTRILFTPLTTGVSLECVTPLSPLLQTFVTTKEGKPHYDPDRRLTPTVIYPNVQSFDEDGVFFSGNVNDRLSTLPGSLVWLIDGKPIEEVWKLTTDGGTTGDYSIDLSQTSNRGALTIYRNFTTKEVHTVKFKGRFVDIRTNQTYRFESNELRMSVSEKGEDAVNCSVSESNIIYDPVMDDLLLYDYKKARGIPTGSAPRESYINGKSYDRIIDVILAVGTEAKKTLPQGVTMQLLVNGTSTPITPGGNHPEVVEVNYPHVRLDLRLIESMDYKLRFMKDGKSICHRYISVKRVSSYPTECKPFRGANLTVKQKQYFNSALVNVGKRWIEFPELYYMIEWFTQARIKVNDTWKLAEIKTWQRGERLSVPVNELGIGYTFNDACFDVWFDLDVHTVASVVTDETGQVLTDESGNVLID